ncbi:hypothetical protein GCM10007989_28500 [Devosia pacifica]|uniref:Uncharacterized protein n=1 Tax=Devosia pacifica TaxID=1335967 RepID=A0A918SBU7_9HYPH|nr:hypothetical protein GCM10007989_28500 [Devosia pacifica]
MLTAVSEAIAVITLTIDSSASENSATDPVTRQASTFVASTTTATNTLAAEIQTVRLSMIGLCRLWRGAVKRRHIPDAIPTQPIVFANDLQVHSHQRERSASH